MKPPSSTRRRCASSPWTPAPIQISASSISVLGISTTQSAQYRSALAILPDNAKYWFNLGNALRAEHRNDDAMDAFSHAIDNDARWATPRYELGTILLELGRPAEAGRQAQTIVALDPGAISGHYLMARSAAAIGRYDVAATEAAAALEIARRSGDEKTIRQMQAALDACKAGRQPAAPEL